MFPTKTYNVDEDRRPRLLFGEDYSHLQGWLVIAKDTTAGYYAPKHRKVRQHA